MRDNDSVLLESAYTFISEATKLAKMYVKDGSLSPEDFENLKKIDPTKQFKYVDWMAKQWVAGGVSDLNLLRNTIEEFNTFLSKGKIKDADIFKFKDFTSLKTEVDRLNATGEALSVKDLESDYEVIVDDGNLLVIVPHTHESSRKLGLTHFKFRDCGDGKKDSAWCTTYKSPDHFNDYYYNNNVTFYYVNVKSPEIQQELLENGYGKEFFVTAIAVLDEERSTQAEERGLPKMEAYDGNDDQVPEEKLYKYLDIIGLR